MASIAPVLRIRGKVRKVEPRTVPAVLPRDAYRDEETGNLVPAREGRDAYDVHDVVVDTDPGGLVELVIMPQAASAIGGLIPSVGDVVDYPVRGYTAWKGSPGRRYATNGYSLAGEVFKAEGLGSAEGRRVSAVS
jgi:hypothetical protein